jgi:hypothetical protein
LPQKGALPQKSGRCLKSTARPALRVRCYRDAVGKIEKIGRQATRINMWTALAQRTWQAVNPMWARVAVAASATATALGAYVLRAVSALPYWATMLIALATVCLLLLALILALMARTQAGLAGATRAQGAPPSQRRLTGHQAAKIEEGLSRLEERLVILHDVSSPDAFKFAEDFAAAFRKARWMVTVAPLLEVQTRPASGVAVEYPPDGMPVPDPKLSPRQTRDFLQAAMSAAELTVDIRERTEMWSNAHGCIIVSHQPGLM